MVGLYIGLIGYIAISFIVSIWSGKAGSKNSKSYIVGERNYGPVLTAFGMGTTLASGFAFIGMVGMGYTMGIIASWQCIFGTILEFCCWYFLAKKCRELSIKTESITPIEAMSHLHGDPKNLIKIIGGLFIGVFMIFYLAGQFNAGAVACSAMGLDASAIAILIAILTVLFIFLGGMNAAMWTNAIQGIIMIAAFFVLIAVALAQVGGVGNLFGQLSITAPELIDWKSGRTSKEAIFYICNYWLGSSMGFLAQPQGVQKFLSLKDNRSARISALMSCVFNIIRQLGPVLIGMCCRLLYPDIANPSAGIPTLILDHMPNVIGGIVMAGIFAAIMSTTEGLLLQGVAELSRNFLQLGVFSKRTISEKSSSMINKILTIALGIGGLLISLFGSGGVFELIVFAWTGLITSFAPPLFFGLYWKKCTSQGMLAGVITGIPSTVIWYYCFKASTGIHEAISLIVPVLAVIIVSLCTQNIKQEENYAAQLAD